MLCLLPDNILKLLKPFGRQQERPLLALNVCSTFIQKPERKCDR